ncbi:MAG: GNAT family N-acetyltransferase [Verrucomicrobiota bacterium]
MSPYPNADKLSLALSFEELPTLADLESRWRDLELRAQPSFYTSWAWIGVWLELLPPDIRPRLLEARHDARVVGMAVVVCGPPRKKFGFTICQTAHLHDTGRPELDILCIEHNDFLLDRDHEAEVRSAMLDYWLGHLDGASEVILPGLVGKGWPPDALGSNRGRMKRVDAADRSYAVDLRAVREADGDFLQLIRPSMRTQIRRSIKEYGRCGELVLEAAASVGQALAWLERLADLHQARWVGRGLPGCFSNAFFTRFHQTLIARHLVDGGVQLLRIRAGENDLGYLYAFVRGGRVYCYQSGFDYGLIEKHARPGLVAHALAVEYNAAQGYDVYDFMAGDMRYKRDLATLDERMTWTTLRSPSWRFECEATVPRVVSATRRLRQAWRQGRLWGQQRIGQAITQTSEGC